MKNYFQCSDRNTWHSNSADGEYGKEKVMSSGMYSLYIQLLTRIGFMIFNRKKFHSFEENDKTHFKVTSIDENYLVTTNRPGQ